MELYLGRDIVPDMELDLEKGLEINGPDADPEDAEPVDAVTCCANVSLLVLFCVLAIVAVLAFTNMPLGPALGLTGVVVTVFLVLMLVITAARDRYVGKQMADNVGSPN
ncbi:unnamed protein product [Urochloa decumbens]|uniref:Uncharacterized protein n=1 Tax=Urochloa decumbens TaxID=240449 RepID=A0ABC8ZHJ1_9POAL